MLNKRLLPYFLILVSSLFACHTHETDPNLKILKFNLSEGLNSLDPAFSRKLESVNMANQLFNGLVKLDQNQNIIPDIAESFEILDSNTLYVFKLRDDISFHQNACFGPDSTRKVRAEDVKYSLERLVDPKLLSPGKWVMNQVNRKSNGDLDIEVIDDLRLSIRLKQAFPPFLGILSMKYCSIVPAEAIQYYGEEFRSHPVGTGPFKFQYWKENTKLVLRKNPNYHLKDQSGVSLPYLDALSISFVKDEEVVFLKFLKGDIHFMTGQKGSYKDELLTPEGDLNERYASTIRFEKLPFLNTEYLGFNLDDNFTSAFPLKNKQIRQALNYGIDRKQILKYLRNSIGFPAVAGFIPRGLAAFNDTIVKGYDHDREKAINLIEMSGYTAANPLPELVISTTSEYLDICENLQYQWSEIGVKVRIEVNPPATNNELIANNEVAFFRKSWVADYPDAENYLSLFYSGNFSPQGPNYTHFSSSTYDSLFYQSLKMTEDSLRISAYQQLDQMIIDEAAVIPLFYDEVVCFSQKHVTDISVSPMKVLDFSLTQIQ